MPLVLNVNNVWDEARWIADKIIENYSQKNKLYSDHLVLSRSGFYTRTLEAIFIEKKIPYIKFGGRKFMESAHIKDVISALRIANNIDDEIAWIRFLTLWEGIGEIKATKYITELLNLKDIDECITWLNSILKNDANVIIPEILKSIVDNRYDVQKALNGAFKLMEKRLSSIYKEDWDKKRRPDFPVLEVLASNYSNLGEFITECLLDASTTPASSEILRSEVDNDKVTISTIHSAKGLESDICFVVNVSPKVFPSAMSIGNIDEIEEDRRVLYVALTRAKNELIITRNLDSIYAESIDEIEFESTEGEIESEIAMEEQYFLNSLPDDIAEQNIIEVQRREVKDIEIPNKLNIEYGMDFS